MEKLGLNKVFISSFLKTLWNRPDIMHHILENTEPEIVKHNLASFVVNDLYCNLLSGKYMENNLLYIIAMMLKEEIDKIDSVDQVDCFLKDTKCSYILEELRKIPDVQMYFKKIILKTVEKIERNYSFREIKFNVEEILTELMKLKKDEEKKHGKKINARDLDEIYRVLINSKVIDLSINFSREENSQKSSKRNEIFIKDYVPDLTNKEFQTRAEKAKKENKINLHKYFKKLENDIEYYHDEDLYSNRVLMKNMLETNAPTYILSFYLNDFLEVLSFLDQLIEDILQNLVLMPSSLKYICKIISILVKNKFKDITKSEINGFVSRFIIDKLLIPIISVPNFNALISEFVISGITIKNIKALNFIIKKMFSGQLFLNNKEEGNYTPFNWYFINKMEKILYFFDKAINVNLPEFIEKYINDELPGDYAYDYFQENKEQFYASISICFKNENIYHLIKGLPKNDRIFEKSDPKIERLKKIMGRLKEEDFIDTDFMRKNTPPVISKKEIVHKESFKKKDKCKELAKENLAEEYYIYNDHAIEKNIEVLFKISNTINNYYLDIKKNDKTLDQKEKNLIKIKNYLCNSLGNYRLLNKSDFNIDSFKSTIKLFNEIKTYMTIPYFLLNNNTIPSVWYMNSVLDYLNKIPEDYKENDFKKLFTELTKNLRESINNLDFEKIILLRNKLKFIDKIYNYYEEARTLITNIRINENLKFWVEEVFLPVDIKFNYDEKEKMFELEKSSIKDKLFEDKIIYQDPKKNLTSFKTIESFTRYFPNIAKYQSMQDINPLDIIKELSINEKINHYFDIIKNKIIKMSLIDEENYEKLYEEKMKNYIMNKIYEKIYPPEPDDNDVKFYKKTMSLAWIEPHLILDKEYIFDNMLPDILNEFKKINEVKTPYKKLNCCKNILTSVVNLIRFNEGIDKEVGSDDITPVLNYVSIKAHPFRLFTDMEFIKLFSKNNGEYENSLVNIESIYYLILDYTNENFNLTQEEYNKKCIDAIKYNEIFNDFN